MSPFPYPLCGGTVQWRRVYSATDPMCNADFSLWQPADGRWRKWCVCVYVCLCSSFLFICRLLWAMLPALRTSVCVCAVCHESNKIMKNVNGCAIALHTIFVFLVYCFFLGRKLIFIIRCSWHGCASRAHAKNAACEIRIT